MDRRPESLGVLGDSLDLEGVLQQTRSIMSCFAAQCVSERVGVSNETSTAGRRRSQWGSTSSEGRRDGNDALSVDREGGTANGTLGGRRSEAREWQVVKGESCTLDVQSNCTFAVEAARASSSTPTASSC